MVADARPHRTDWAASCIPPRWPTMARRMRSCCCRAAFPVRRRTLLGLQRCGGICGL